MNLVRGDDEATIHQDPHRWQHTNPVTTEALIQLTLGAPQLIYNGGLLMSRLRYFDLSRKRPGLPQDTAALVERLEANRTVVRLVNLSPFETRDMLVQGGSFGEHRFTAVQYTHRTSEYPGATEAYAAPPVTEDARSVSVEGSHVRVVLPPATEITLDLGTAPFVNEPSAALPW